MMIDKFIVDSSVFIPLISANEAMHHFYSKKLWDYVYNRRLKIVMPTIVLHEVFHALKKSGFFNENNAHEIFIDFFNYPNFQHLNLNLEFFNLFKQTDFFDNLKTSDAIIACCALLTKAPLITWDKRLIANSYEAYTPEEFVKKFTA